MGNYVIAVGNYMIVSPSELGNYKIVDKWTDDGQIQGGELASITYRRSWAKARRDTLSTAEAASPLAGRVYDLRHACVSTWLNGGIPPAQVAEWAGHSVAILLKIYAKCLDGQDHVNKRRIQDALGDPADDE